MLDWKLDFINDEWTAQYKKHYCASFLKPIKYEQKRRREGEREKIKKERKGRARRKLDFINDE